MAILTVGPTSTFPSIAAAMAAAGPGDIISLEAGYSNETATVLHSGMTIDGGADSLGIVLELGTGIATVTLAGDAPINVVDASDGNGIVGNEGDNLITVTAGADSVSGGAGEDRLFVDYRLATGAVTGNSASNVAEAGGGGRLVTINGGFEHVTIWTGSGADTITTGDGNDDIRTGDGVGTITAGEGANTIIGGIDADTITAGGGGNFVDAGDGTNTVTTGGGADEILTGRGADTIVAGAGDDRITVTGGADTVDTGADSDLLIVDYSAATTNVVGGVTGGNFGTGYTGHLADAATATLNFVAAERFWIMTGSGDDVINTGAGDDNISTGDGNDWLNGDAGLDVLDGGNGDDSYVVFDAGDDVIEFADAGFDSVYSATDYMLGETTEVEILSTIDWLAATPIALTGNAGANIVFGNAGDNVLNGAGGADTLIGFGGEDSYVVDDAGDVVIENAGQGYDTVYAQADYALADGSDVQVLSTADWLSTDSLNLTGNSLVNTLFGNAGDNILNGGAGGDYLVGFDGADSFAFTTALGGGDVDTIADFVAGTDSFALDDAIFTAIGGPGALDANAFVTGSAAADADDRIIYDSATGHLFYDADGNGDGAAVQFATVGTGLALSAADFFVI